MKEIIAMNKCEYCGSEIINGVCQNLNPPDFFEGPEFMDDFIYMEYHEINEVEEAEYKETKRRELRFKYFDWPICQSPLIMVIDTWHGTRGEVNWAKVVWQTRDIKFYILRFKYIWLPRIKGLSVSKLHNRFARFCAKIN